MTIAVVGNPNSGKTTLFNSLTGGKQRIGNWPGVTVEKKVGSLKYQDTVMTVVDLPGIYSLTAHSEDERVARNYILSGEADLIINIVDSTNLERNLYLTTHLLEMRVPLLLVLNMVDLAINKKIIIDVDMLAKALDIPVIGISAISKNDIKRVKTKIIEIIDKKHISKIFIKYPNEVEDIITKWSTRLHDNTPSDHSAYRWQAIKLLERGKSITRRILDKGILDKDKIDQSIKSIENVLHQEINTLFADYRYGFIQAILKNAMHLPISRKSATDKIDAVVMHRIWGIPIFLLIMYLLFWFTMNISDVFLNFFDIFSQTLFVDGAAFLLTSVNAPQWLITILAHGIGSGIQTVAAFIPIIFTMFFLLSILEDSGYMARAAFIADRFMRKIGLPGKAFVPLLVGFGCTIPAVMATRTLENKKDRYLTVFITPMMSCGARLPVYAIFAAAFFPGIAGSIVFSLYLVGIILAILTGFLLKNTLFRGEASYFIMELPPYHAPRLKHIFIHTWIRLKTFLVRAGVFIVIAITILGLFNSLGIDGSLGNENTDKSILSNVGKTITPVFEPMGIENKNWPATVSLFTGIFAKEAVIGTLNSLYGQTDAAQEVDAVQNDFNFGEQVMQALISIPQGLLNLLNSMLSFFGLDVSGFFPEQGEEDVENEEGLITVLNAKFSGNGARAYAYLLFVLIYLPCLGALITIIREIGIAYGLLAGTYLTFLGWITATLFYQVITGHNITWIIIPLIIFGGIIGMFIFLGKRRAKKKV